MDQRTLSGMKLKEGMTRSWSNHRGGPISEGGFFHGAKTRNQGPAILTNMHFPGTSA
jgi:hypothetical protein